MGREGSFQPPKAAEKILRCVCGGRQWIFALKIDKIAPQNIFACGALTLSLGYFRSAQVTYNKIGCFPSFRAQVSVCGMKTMMI